jgi:hypothetical protein
MAFRKPTSTFAPGMARCTVRDANAKPSPATVAQTAVQVTVDARLLDQLGD